MGVSNSFSDSYYPLFNLFEINIQRQQFLCFERILPFDTKSTETLGGDKFLPFDTESGWEKTVSNIDSYEDNENIVGNGK